MADKTIAAVCIDKLTTELREFDLPDIPPDGGLLKLEVAGVCGSDWGSYRRSGVQRIMGHENIGRVAKLGSVAGRKWGVKEGDLVALEEYLPCGHCELCRSGDFRLCEETEIAHEGALRYGSTGLAAAPSLWGGFSQYMYLHPNAVIHPVRGEAKPEHLAMAIPLSNGVQWAQFEVSPPGKTYLIQGPGQQGLACTMAAKAAGAECIIVSGLHRDQSRLEVAKAFGADYTIDVEQEDLFERVQAITAGKGAGVVIDVAGGPTTLLDAVKCSAKAATIVFSAAGNEIPSFPGHDLINKRLTIKALRGHSYQAVETALRLITSGNYPLHLMSTHHFTLSQVDLAIKSIGGEGVEGAIHVSVSPVP